MSKFLFAFLLMALLVIVAGCGANSGSLGWDSAEKLELNGKHDRALDLAKKIFEKNMKTMSGAAVSNLASGQYASVEEYIPEDILKLTKEINHNPDNADLIARRGFIYSAINEFEFAIRDFDRALILDTCPDIMIVNIPSDGSVLLCRALAKWQSGKNTEAIEDLDKVLLADGEYDRAYYYRGVIKEASGDPGGAIQDLIYAVRYGSQEYYQYMLGELMMPEVRKETISSTFLTTYFSNKDPLSRPFAYSWMINQ